LVDYHKWNTDDYHVVWHEELDKRRHWRVYFIWYETYFLFKS